MKESLKIALLGAAGVILACQPARAQFTVNDLYLGFTQPTASSDLILDLGQASSLIGKSSVIDLSASLSGLSSFNSTFSSSPNGVSMAVIGGDNLFGQFGVFATQVRSGGPGASAVVAGSSITAGHTSALMSGGASVVSGLVSGQQPTAGNSLLDSSKSYSAAEVPTSASSFVGKTGVNPTGTMDGSGIIYEDLYKATTSLAYTYEGYFTFDYGHDLLTFTPAAISAVPEPSFYGVIAGAGLLLVSLRKQLRFGNA